MRECAGAKAVCAHTYMRRRESRHERAGRQKLWWLHDRESEKRPGGRREKKSRKADKEREVRAETSSSKEGKKEASSRKKR